MPSFCLPFLQSLLPHRQGYKGHLDEDVAESEVRGLSSEDEGQPEVGVASSKASNVMEVDIECRDLEVKNYDWLVVALGAFQNNLLVN